MIPNILSADISTIFALTLFDTNVLFSYNISVSMYPFVRIGFENAESGRGFPLEMVIPAAFLE